MVTDPIGDFIIRIKNASARGLASTVVPNSDLKSRIADKLVEVGYLKSASKKGKKVRKYLELELAYKDKLPNVHDVKRISKPGKRIYQGVDELSGVMSGYGVMIVSTPKGIMTDKDARKRKVGGEVLFAIW
ncbi:MAG: 30S ribosomal protein S8 [Patescibacteria group bacterium]